MNKLIEAKAFQIGEYMCKPVDRFTGKPLKNSSPKVRTEDLNILLFNFS